MEYTRHDAEDIFDGKPGESQDRDAVVERILDALVAAHDAGYDSAYPEDP